MGTTEPFEMPTPKIIEEFQHDGGEYIHKKCWTTYEPTDLMDGLRWIREHYHECKNEFFFSFAQGVWVKVRVLDNGLTEIVTFNGTLTGSQAQYREQTHTARLYPGSTPPAGPPGVTIDLEEMSKDLEEEGKYHCGVCGGGVEQWPDKTGWRHSHSSTCCELTPVLKENSE